MFVFYVHKKRNIQRNVQRNATWPKLVRRHEGIVRSVNGASTDSDTDGLMLDIITSTYYDLL